MRFHNALVIASALITTPLAAQDNPFALTGGSVKSAYILYDVTGKDRKQVQGTSYELGVAGDRMIMRMVAPFELSGKKDTARFVVLATKDSQYAYSAMSGESTGEVSPLLRPHLARAYAALDAAGKTRFQQNVKLTMESSGSSDADGFMTLVGEKAGSETIAGHQCDVYRTKTSSACVMPHAPMVMLRWQDSKQGLNLVARQVKLNGPLPSAPALLPKGIKWERKGPDDADFITNVWSLKKQTDPDKVSPATLAQFGVQYLASSKATAELRDMGAGVSQDTPSETGEAEADSTDEGR